MRDPRIPRDSDSDRTHEHEHVPDQITARLSADRAHAEAESDGYSATALGSHWFERPEPETLRQPESATEKATLVQGGQPADVAPDRVEGDVLRFGPGVTAVVAGRVPHNSTAAVWHGTLAGQSDGPEQPRERRRSGLRRYALAGTVLLAVLIFLAWQRYGPALAVQDVAVQTSAEGPGCDGTADVVGVVKTNGRPGTVTYRWIRSDGTTSGLLREKLTRGQKQARLHLLWTFHGRGEYRAAAELRIVSPSAHTAAAQFTYRCV
ncbi:hypothetical protein AB0F96_01175 [Streptomyces sp. NPDC023998]|uniref:hypothetical protein n=1 Tax=Streptomyces sp. NPDC023998 TaxID=3154597 RepID=UPI0033C6BC1C